MRYVPTYALYGEPGARDGAELVHCETIEDRSRLHDFRIAAHRHDQLFQLLLLLGGSGEVVLDGIRSALAPVSLVLIPATVVHGYSFSNMVDGFVVTLYQAEFERILRAFPAAARCLGRPQIVPVDAGASGIVDCIRSVALEYAGHAPGRHTMLEAHLMAAWIGAYRVQTASAELGQSAVTRGAAHAQRFRDMVDRNFQLRRPVEDYASELGMTPVHLRRLCHAHFGTSPKGLLNARAILEAKRLLVFSALNVQEIAAATGFDDHAYFSRFFRHMAGLSPTAFRARQRRTGP